MAPWPWPFRTGHGHGMLPHPQTALRILMQHRRRMEFQPRQPQPWRSTSYLFLVDRPRELPLESWHPTWCTFLDSSKSQPIPGVPISHCRIQRRQQTSLQFLESLGTLTLSDRNPLAHPWGPSGPHPAGLQNGGRARTVQRTPPMGTEDFRAMIRSFLAALPQPRRYPPHSLPRCLPILGHLEEQPKLCVHPQQSTEAAIHPWRISRARPFRSEQRQ
mmetsp:Transcript_8259/g.16556  ORF Transcript_8259/g.16556 Transcript_8259/m.16556 type:complete len:217 (+) Transcript_8259:1199-1849(+)